MTLLRAMIINIIIIYHQMSRAENRFILMIFLGGGDCMCMVPNLMSDPDLALTWLLTL